jgi:hypothetical protein
MKANPSKILIETNERLNKEMNELFGEITNIIRKAEPIQLIEELSARLMLTNDFTGNINAFLSLSQLEFILGIILNRDRNLTEKTITPLDNAEIIALASKVEKYFANWAFTYHFKKQNTQLSQNDSEKERDRLISSLVTHHSTVRGDNFLDQEEYQLLELFTPFKEWMDSNLGFNIEDALYFIQRITKYYTTKLDLFIESSFQDTNKNSSPDNYQRTKIIKQKPNMTPEPIIGVLIFRELDVLGPDIQYNDRFNSFLNCFSAIYGQTFNENFKFPSDNNIFRSKPIFKYHQEFIVPSPSSLLWVMQSVFENEMKNDSKQWEKYQRQKGKYLESEVASEFKKIFPKATIHQSLFYKVIKDGVLKTFELDGLVIYDTNIILVESKSGVFSENARYGGVKRLERVIKDNIENAFEQANRARDYINNIEISVFYDEKGNELLRIEQANYYRIFLINLTLHNFGEVTTMLQNFRKAEL